MIFISRVLSIILLYLSDVTYFNLLMSVKFRHYRYLCNMELFAVVNLH